MLGRRCGVPLPALTLDADLAHGVGEIELGEEDAATVADRILVDEPDAGRGEHARGDALEPAPGQAVVDPLAEQHQQRRRTGAAPAPPRLGDGRAARRRTRPCRRALSRARAVGPMPTGGASRASVLAIDIVGILSTSTVCSRIGPRV